MTGWTIATVVVAAPTLLFVLLLVSALVEARLIAPHERAEKVRAALDRGYEPDDVERMVTGLADQAISSQRSHRAAEGG